jgi:hypothetical protein
MPILAIVELAKIALREPTPRRSALCGARPAHTMRSMHRNQPAVFNPAARRACQAVALLLGLIVELGYRGRAVRRWLAARPR